MKARQFNAASKGSRTFGSTLEFAGDSALLNVPKGVAGSWLAFGVHSVLSRLQRPRRGSGSVGGSWRCEDAARAARVG